MEELNLFAIYLDILNKNKVPYFVTGSVATIVYGDPRLTHDIDLVVNLENTDVNLFIESFPSDEFYCPPEDIIKIEMSRNSRGHFNIIHKETGFKADMYLTGNDDLQLWAMKNCKIIDFAGSKIRVAPPEYVIVKKLEFYKEGHSQKHISDISSILANSNELIDFELLNKLIDERGLAQEWKEVQKI